MNAEQTGMNNKSTIKQYVTALRRMKLSDIDLKMLSTHYRFPNHVTTMDEFSKAMDWKNYRAGNANYGRLAQRVAEEIGSGYMDIQCLCRFRKENGGHWIMTMQPQVAQALEQLGWT
jgi:hypothetical protein